MIPMRFATSRASWSCVRCTYAFLRPSGRMSVFTFAHFTSYRARTASLIWGLLALMSTRNTRVLISSIFFIADSVVTGHWMILYLSILFMRFTDFLGYLGSLGLTRVFGLKKCTFVRTFFTFLDTEAFTALATLPAFFDPFVCPSAASPARASFLVFAMVPM